MGAGNSNKGWYVSKIGGLAPCRSLGRVDKVTIERLTERVHEILRPRLQPGDVAVDATAGNGHDTKFLAEAVGPEGRVFAFDLQRSAIEATRDRLASEALGNVTLIQENHANLAEFLPREHHGRVAAITFNLGYLPGSDKTATTDAATTRQAIEAGLSWLCPGGVMTILAYTGHPGGREETDSVENFLSTLSPRSFDVTVHDPAKERAPRLFVVIRQGKPD